MHSISVSVFNHMFVSRKKKRDSKRFDSRIRTNTRHKGKGSEAWWPWTGTERLDEGFKLQERGIRTTPQKTCRCSMRGKAGTKQNGDKRCPKTSTKSRLQCKWLLWSGALNDDTRTDLYMGCSHDRFASNHEAQFLPRLGERKMCTF